MTDIALVQQPMGGFDIALVNGDLQADAGLESAVILSLHLDARAQGESGKNERGWWADALEGARPVGSKLWLLERCKTDQDTLLAAKAYAEDALAWLVRDGLAQSVQVQAMRLNHALCLQIQIRRPDGGLYSHLWQAQALKNYSSIGG